MKLPVIVLAVAVLILSLSFNTYQRQTNQRLDQLEQKVNK